LVEVFSANTGVLKRRNNAPYQAPAFKNLQVSVRDRNGDGVPDQVVLTAKKGKKTMTAAFPG
jgi:hypothetical protein